jgi:hypothetical protein
MRPSCQRLDEQEQHIVPKNKPDLDKDERGKLPVTAEVGSEGGSYADPTVQEATRKGNLPEAEENERSSATTGAVAGAVGPQAQDPADGVRTQTAKGSTGDYSATKAPENREHVTSRSQSGDPALIPGGPHGAPVDVGMEALYHEAVPNHARDPGQTEEGGSKTQRKE